MVEAVGPSPDPPFLFGGGSGGGSLGSRLSQIVCCEVWGTHVEEQEGEEEEEGGVCFPQRLYLVPLICYKVRPPDAHWRCDRGGYGSCGLFCILIGC